MADIMHFMHVSGKQECDSHRRINLASAQYSETPTLRVIELTDIAFSIDPSIANTDSVEIRPISDDGRNYFQSVFGMVLVSARMTAPDAAAYIDRLDMDGLGYTIDGQEDETPAMMQMQAD